MILYCTLLVEIDSIYFWFIVLNYRCIVIYKGWLIISLFNRISIPILLNLNWQVQRHWRLSRLHLKLA